jgi:hypothetical protein
MIYSGMIHDVPDTQYLYLILWNQTSFPVRNDATVNRCILQPMAPQIQD